MSALGDLLKELFPIRGMSEQILGTQRTDTIVKFGSVIAREVKSVTVATVSAAINKTKQAGGAVGSAASGAGGAIFDAVKNYFVGMVSTLKNQTMPIFGQLVRNILRDLSKLGLNLPGGLLRGAGAVVGGAGRAAMGAISTPFTVVAKGLSGITRFADTITNIGLKIAVVRYLLDSSVGLFRRFTTGLADSNRDLARWNGSIAASFNKLDMTRMRLDIQQGRATRGSTTELNNQLAALLQEVQPIREGMSTVVNFVGINLVKIATNTVQALKEMQNFFPAIKGVVDAIQKVEDELKKGGNDRPLGNTLLGGLAHGFKGFDVKNIKDGGLDGIARPGQGGLLIRQQFVGRHREKRGRHH